jgi:signal transduction histidine kinase
VRELEALLEAERAAHRAAERAGRVAERAAHEARRGLELRDRLVAIVGHDLRTPLAAIRMSVALVLRHRVSKEQARALARVSSSAARMTRIVGDLLDFSRLASGGRIPVQLRTADVASVVRRALAELQAVHPDRQLVLDAPGAAVARVDPERIAQVVSTLVGSGLQRAPGAAVEVAVERSEDAVVVRVHDAGPPLRGDPAELFEPFRRGRAGPEAGSVGLGLYIAREVLRAHGATVEVASREGEGTTFTVRLPMPSPRTGRPAADR